jgi:hypothetical protein
MSTGRLGAGDTAIQPTILNAKADLLTATAADTPARLAVGADGTVLTAASGEATGLQWAAPAAGGQMFVSNAGSSGQIQARGQWANYNTETSSVFGITHGTTQTYTGLVFKSSSSNVSGTIRVYGLVKS